LVYVFRTVSSAADRLRAARWKPGRLHVGHPLRIVVIVVGVVVAALVIAVASVIPFSSETARRKLIDVLADRLNADVELADLRIRVLPQFAAEGHGLAIRQKGRGNVPPLISIERFAAEGNLLGLLHRHIARVVVDRLDIEIPPDRDDDDDANNARTQAGSKSGGGSSSALGGPGTFVIDELISKDARLVIIPHHADKPPKVWSIHQLRMNNVSSDQAMPFAATLDNAVPPGSIETSGSFGPWQSDRPGNTPLDGRFTFEHADLSVFKGVAGNLAARGTFGGALQRIDIHGETDTPDFMVAAGGHPMALHANYHTIVDGTNGNTFLEQVDARFLNTALTAKGAVAGTPGAEGRTVTLDVDMQQARLEDVLRLAVKADPPPMTGALKLTTKFVLPPGDRDVVDRLQLQGGFVISDTRFTSGEVQQKINELSHRTRGKDPDVAPQRVASQFAGTFRLRDGRVTIPHVTFNVPGAVVRLTGSYGLKSERIDFTGTAFTDAKISEMTHGVMSLLLKPADLLFKRNGGGSRIPIKIGGTRKSPDFGLDKSRVFKR
jgi:hypothetical protein